MERTSCVVRIMTRERKLAIKMWEEIVEKLKKGDELFNAVRL